MLDWTKKAETRFNKIGFSETGFSETIWETYRDEWVSVLCMRYWYRGKLVKAGKDYIVLDNCAAVEQTGPAGQPGENMTDDQIPSPIVIKTMAVEIVGQMAWTSRGREGEQKEIQKEKMENK